MADFAAVNEKLKEHQKKHVIKLDESSEDDLSFINITQSVMSESRKGSLTSVKKKNSMVSSQNGGIKKMNTAKEPNSSAKKLDINNSFESIGSKSLSIELDSDIEKSDFSTKALRKAFDKMDKDQNGFITSEELKETLRSLGDVVAEKDVQDMI